MKSSEIRQQFIEFFRRRGHAIVSSSSLLPNDPSVLLTTAGMQQFKPYYLGEKSPWGENVASIQKCFRTSDIDEVGDESHLTFFEMLGHFSFGDYFKKETIAWTYELLTKVFGVSQDRISATVFEGDSSVPFDEESYLMWKKFLPENRIRKGKRTDNFWGPAGTEGPCGVCNEVYVDETEVATLVFMEFYCRQDKKLEPLTHKGVDVGWGLERIVRVLQQKPTIFETDLFAPLMLRLPEDLPERKKRIIVDHSRGTAFLIADGVRPSNKEAGYILRRLLRRIIAYGTAVEEDVFVEIIKNYNLFYPELNLEDIMEVFRAENGKFTRTLQEGLKEIKKLGLIDAKEAFKLYESYGLPYETIKEVAGPKAEKLQREDFDAEFKKHQELSRTSSVGML